MNQKQRKLKWNEETLNMECVECGEYVSNMRIKTSISIGLTWVDGDEDEEIFGCDEWNYTNVRLECPCGTVIKADEVDGFDCADFTFTDAAGECWHVTIPKPVTEERVISGENTDALD